MDFFDATDSILALRDDSFVGPTAQQGAPGDSGAFASRLRPQAQSLAGVPCAVILRHAPWVRQEAQSLMRRLPASVDKGDLVQVGLIAVAHAAVTFRQSTTTTKVDAEQAFQAYARKRVRGSMLDELRRLDPLTRDQRRKVKRLQLARQAWLQSHGTLPSLAHLAQHCGIRIEEVSWLEALAASVVDSRDGLTPEVHSDPSPDLATAVDDVESRVDAAIVLERLGKVWDRLPGRDQQVVGAYLGEGPSPAQLARQMQVSAARVSQWHRQAIEHMAWKVGTRPRVPSLRATRT